MAQSNSEPSDWRVLLQLDNDLFSGSGSDRDYTSGVRIGAVREVPLDSELGQRINKRLEKGAKKLNEYSLQSFRVRDNIESFATGYALTQLLFTPEDRNALSAPEGERPYAAWLGFEVSWHVKTRNFINSFTWSVGSTGDAALGEEAQNWAHRNLTGDPLFQGWDSQVAGELTVNAHFDHKQRLVKLSQKKFLGLELDGFYEAGAAVGNFQTNAYLGGLARIGYQLSESFTTPRVQLGSYGHKLFAKDYDQTNRFSAYAYAGLRGTAVVHDITLDGPVFRDFDTTVESRPFVGEALFGLGVRYKKIDLVFSQIFRSDEFVGQTENQQFGSLLLRFQSGF